VRVLVIDTSSSAVTAGVVQVSADEVTALAVRSTVDARAHGELLAPSIAAVMDESGTSFSALDAVVAGVGPGPFTGLRVGLVTAVAIHHALSIAAYAVCSLDAIGWAVDTQQAVQSRRILVAADARRREVYWATYIDGRREMGPDVTKPATLLDGVTAAVDAMAGAGARLYAEQLALPLLEGFDHPQVIALASLAADRVLGLAASEPLTPLYLRRPDAVEPTSRKAVMQ
jgi:tRNA threonylcarbamoyl adenosine modification protein YeaZ